MKKNPKNSSASVQSQLSQQQEQQQATPLSTLTLDELESVQGGGGTYYEKTPPAQTGTFGKIFAVISAIANSTYESQQANFEYDGGEGDWCAYCS